MELTKYYAQVDGQRRAFSVVQAAQALEGENLIELQEFDESVLGKVHNQATGLWDAAPAMSPSRRVSVLGFRRRFMPAEKAAIEWAAVDRSDQPEAQRKQAAALRATLADQAAAQYIDLDDTDTVQGVQGLEAGGILAPGRAAEILTATIQPEELP